MEHCDLVATGVLAFLHELFASAHSRAGAVLGQELLHELDRLDRIAKDDDTASLPFLVGFVLLGDLVKILEQEARALMSGAYMDMLPNGR
jgi:hypothetical protein